jgi:uncharacterized protein
MNMIESTPDDRSWAAGSHLAALSGHVIPFGNVLGPLIVWLIRREHSPYVDQHGKDAINFQISTLVYSFVLIAIGFFGFLRSLPMLDSPHFQGADMPLFGIMPVAILLFALLWLAWFIEVIVAAVAAAGGKTFNYIGSIRFIA